MRKLIAVVLSVVLILSLAACTARLELSAEIMPDELAEFIMAKPEKFMKACGIDEEDLVNGALNKDGHNYLVQKVMIFGQVFDMDFEVYNNAVETVAFSISKDTPNMEDKKLFIGLLEDMTEAYGEPTTNEGDGRRYAFNPNYYLEDDANLYEEWVYENYDIQLIHDVDPEGVMHTKIIVVVHVDLNEVVR